jgi:hypothetical protein
MSHAAPLISKIILIFSLAALTACSTGDKPNEIVSVRKAPEQQIFYYPFDQVWRAAHAVLKYPIANENPVSGYLETEFIKGVDGFLPPDKTKPPSAGIRYKIVMSFAKGHTDDRVSTRITIDKRMEVLRDFFSEPEPMASDGLEEKILFYRIERELIIYETLKKVN